MYLKVLSYNFFFFFLGGGEVQIFSEVKVAIEKRDVFGPPIFCVSFFGHLQEDRDTRTHAHTHTYTLSLLVRLRCVILI